MQTKSVLEMTHPSTFSVDVVFDVADTVASSLFHTLMILSVKNVVVDQFLHYVCEVSGCVLLFDRGDKIRKVSDI